ncbi:MAG TPA: AMP-binding protein, partial [Novosphingobium sp.]|nr:AMP-binding protein [Novosphingobium sp.]
AYLTADARLKVVVSQHELLGRLAVALAQQADLRLVLAEGGDGGADLAQWRAAGGQVAPAAAEAGDVALICYSSGTTGFPKGVMLSHRNLREGGLATAVPCGFTPDDRVLISAPLAYTWGAVQYLREALATGATAVLVDPAIGVEELLDVLTGERISLWSGVPILFERVAASPRFAGTAFPHLRHAVSGGTSLDLLRQWQAKGVRLTQAYGLTETAGHVALLFGEHAEGRLGSAGRALLGVDLAIADEEGGFLPAGHSGEILVRGAMVMQGYLNNPEETARAMRGDWLCTGDIGTIDAEGFLTVTGRKKDMLRSGGLNIYPAELERVLAGIAGMAECAVIGVADETWGEVPMLIVHGEGELDVEALRARCLTQLAGYKRPRYLLDYGAPLPRTFSGKIMKHALRAEFAVAPEQARRLTYSA